MHPTARQLQIAQLALLIGLVVCLVLLPRFLFETNEGGISNYGTYARTVVPFTLGFGLCGVFTIMAAWSLPRQTLKYRWLKGALLVSGLLYFLVMVSTYPYKLGHGFDALHVYAGVALVLWDMAFGSWLALILEHNWVNVALLVVQYIGFTLALLTYLGPLHTLFIAECLTSAAFGTLLVRSVRQHLADKSTAVQGVHAATAGSTATRR